MNQSKVMNFLKGRFGLASVYVFIGVVGRLIPHPANVTPFTNLSLFSGAKMSRGKALAITLGALLLSDVLLAVLMGYPLFGVWTFFTFTGFAAIVFIGSFLPQNLRLRGVLPYVVGASLGYWLWTNLGSWLTCIPHPKTFVGLIACYTAALPFLRNALLGDVVWMAVIFGATQWVSKRQGGLLQNWQ